MIAMDLNQANWIMRICFLGRGEGFKIKPEKMKNQKMSETHFYLIH
jgi:hypothetical protein